MRIPEATGRTTLTQEPEDRHGLGTIVAIASGFGLGVLCGLITGELLGDVHPDRVRRVVGRIRPALDETPDPDLLESEFRSALQGNAATRDAQIGVRALGDGIMELTGTVADERVRALAQRVVTGIPGANVIVNRLLVTGTDTAEQPDASIHPAT